MIHAIPVCFSVDIALDTGKAGIVEKKLQQLATLEAHMGRVAPIFVQVDNGRFGVGRPQ
jgi:hypothetical protein